MKRETMDRELLPEWQQNVLIGLWAKVEALREEVAKYNKPHKGLLRSLKNAEIDAGLAEGRFFTEEK